MLKPPPKIVHPFDSGLHPLEELLARHGRPTSPVYCISLILVGTVLLFVPFIQIDMTVRGEGAFRPVSERQEIRARAPGFVADVAVSENERVRTSQLLIRMNSPVLQENLSHLNQRITTMELDFRDLEQLVQAFSHPGSTSAEPVLGQSYRRAELDKYRAQCREAAIEIDKASRELDRSSRLRQEGLVSEAEAEAAVHLHRRAVASLDSLERAQMAKWNAELEERRLGLKSLRSELQRLESDHAMLSISAPVGGTIEQMSGLSRGTYLQTGDRIAVLSPDADLHAEVFVETRDAAHLYVGQSVRLQVDAFPYTEWGWVPGRVSSISEDAIVVGGRARFRALVRMFGPELTLHGGIRGRIQKGMTLQARFVGRKRELWRVIFDRTSAWWDPA